jgi:hypothetical protein
MESIGPFAVFSANLAKDIMPEYAPVSKQVISKISLMNVTQTGLANLIEFSRSLCVAWSQLSGLVRSPMANYYLADVEFLGSEYAQAKM